MKGESFKNETDEQRKQIEQYEKSGKVFGGTVGIQSDADQDMRSQS